VVRTRIPILLLVVYAAALGASHAEPQRAGRRRALLIGINDYTASRLGDARRAPAPDRDWPNLLGTLNDVLTIEETLSSLYGFERRDIFKLTDQHATRSAILDAIKNHLLAPAEQGDVIFFYYAGHGSQVRNTLSDEPDQLDESIVPADSRLGVPDIRDKELRALFNRILDRGARLTILLDNCHSGSGARGLASGARPRGVEPDWRDIKDPAVGPRPEERGALVLSATEDFDKAWETRDEDGKMHGAFSWAWIRAMRDSVAGESAIETFLRAQARMRAETPFQEPVIAGDDNARLNPFLGVRSDRLGERAVIGVEKIRKDGTIVLRGGWLNGLTVGSELRLFGASGSATKIKITALLGSSQSEARVHSGSAADIGSGALLEIVSWAPPPGRPLRVWSADANVTNDFVRKLAAAAERRNLQWITDPIEVTPAHVLRRNVRGWELLGLHGAIERLGSDARALAAIGTLRGNTSIFVQLPAPQGWSTDVEGVQHVANAEDADYMLVGRYAKRRIEYAWVRPSVSRDDRGKSGIPLRTDWTSGDRRTALREGLLRLRRIHAWHMLEPPSPSQYRLALQRKDSGEIVRAGAPVLGGATYKLLLTAPPSSKRIARRYYYAFVIDSWGRSVLASPSGGSVENRFPLAGPPPQRIELGDSIDIREPYGVDTYFLLSTDEPLPNPWILEWNGVRTRTPDELTPLEELLLAIGSGTRAPHLLTPRSWSLDRVVFESVPPRAPMRVSDSRPPSR
jgi:Caspase domain